MTTDSYRIGRLTLQPGRQLLGADATPRAIGGRALEILAVLAARAGSLVLKDELVAAVWNGAIVEDNALQVQISALRRALGDEAPRLVTVHGRGYRLVLDPPVPVGSPQPLDRVDSPARAEAGSVAVLAFENLTGDPHNAYLADGLAEELIVTLSRGAGLRVPARTSSFAYRGRSVDVRTIARELGVASVIEGSLRTAAPRLCASVRLIDADSGFQTWSHEATREACDLLGLQEDLAHAVAAALHRALAPQRRPTHDNEAMRLILEARAMSRTQSPASLAGAERAARAALSLDPDFARAWESLAGIRLVQVNLGQADRSTLAEVRTFAQQALALDPGRGGALGMLATIEAGRGRLGAAMDLMARGMAADPANLVLDESRALTLLLPAGRLAQAAASADRSIALAPSRPQPRLVRALCDALAGDTAAARAQLETGLLLGQNPATPLVALARAEITFAEGRPAEGMAVLADLLLSKLPPDDTAELRALADGAPAANAALLARLAERADRSGALWRQVMLAGLLLRWQVELGALDDALDTAERIVARYRESGDVALGSLTVAWSTGMAGLRADPRFSAIAGGLGLHAFWNEHGPPDGHRIVGETLAPGA